jgi:hypothetical protein
MGFDRARQKSFGEPTRVRTDGSKPENATRAEPDANNPQRAASSSYEKYKQSLHAFFNGEKPLPEHLKEMLATRPGAQAHMPDMPEAEVETQPAKKSAVKAVPEERKARRMVAQPGADVAALVDAVRKASSPREIETAIDALKAKGHPLPLDGDILSKALNHPSEDVLTEAMQGLSSVVDDGGVKVTQLLKTRVKNVQLLASSSELKELCQQVSAKLG